MSTYLFKDVYSVLSEKKETSQNLKLSHYKLPMHIDLYTYIDMPGHTCRRIFTKMLIPVGDGISGDFFLI